MGVAGGPNIEIDGLVFGYDTGYGVADNSTATKFYPGAPTTNLNADPYHSSKSAGDTVTLAAWGGDTGVGSFEVNTSPPGGGMMFINHNTSNPAGTGGTYTDFPTTRYTLTNGVTYTRSWWAKCDDVRSVSGHICSCNRDSDNTYIVGSSISLNTYWKRFTHTFTYSGTTSSDWQFRHIVYDASKVYIANVQLEAKGFSTPFVNGSRSNTTSLIDLTKTTNIDVSNVSFDSSGQPTFDGTDDYIDLGDDSRFDFDNGIMTVEAIVTFPSSWTAGSQYPNIVSKGASAGWDTDGWSLFGFRDWGGGKSWGLGIRNGATNRIVSRQNVAEDVYWHIVGTLDGTTMRLYENGVEVSTNTQTINPANNNTSVRIARDPNSNYFPGEIPVVKIYNRALTAAEIQQNYNAYKNRFNI